MQVKVCDALCGAGKTSACINMMNERVDTKFIFVTQYLTEVERIKQGCASRGFVSPDSDLNIGHTKLADIHRLMTAGRNIATTHSLFISYTEETKRLIREQKYVLVLDESVDVLCMSDVTGGDLNILIRSESVKEEDGMLKWIDDSYDKDDRGRFREEMLRAKSKNFLKYDDEYFFWSIPPELFTCFTEAYVLTYMFHAQTLRCFFDLYRIKYELIGTKKTGDKYEFCDITEMNRTRELRDKIHILDNDKLNAIGNGRTSLSFSWYRHSRTEEDMPDLVRIHNNINNLYKNIWKVSSREVMWTTYKEYESIVAGKGYKSAFVTYNKRASNEYCDRRYLAYCVNNFPRPWESRYFKEHGVEVDGDSYAVSILVQWIFRSAIRKGEEVWVYIPSERMRSLLTTWLDNLAEGKDLEPLVYKTPRKSRAKPGAKRGRPIGSTKKKNKSKSKKGN